MDDVKLKKYWEKHIANKRLYHVLSAEYLPSIKKSGLDPKNNPYKSKYSKIRKLYKLLLWLEKKHAFSHRQDWGKLVNSEKIVQVGERDMKLGCIDFTPYMREVRFYRRLMKGNGGALVSSVQKITKDILERKPKLPMFFPKRIITELHDWTVSKGIFGVKTLAVKGSARCFETAIFQNKHVLGRDVECPFGSFEHFKKVVDKNGLDIYSPFFEDDKWFNIRVKDKIPSEDIKVV